MTRKPNWKKIKHELTKEQLEHLIAVGNGRTEERKQNYAKLEKNNLNKPRKERKSHAKLWKSNLRINSEKMVRLANIGSQLEQDMRLQEKNTGLRR